MKLTYTVVNQMYVRIFEVSNAGAVLLDRKSGIEFIVEVYCEWIPVRHKHPLTHVKLSIGYYQRIFHVLLNDPLRTISVIYSHTSFIQFSAIIISNVPEP